MKNKHWEIHNVDEHIVFVEVQESTSRCLFMDDLCEQVVGVEVVKNLSPYLTNEDEIEEKGGEIYETQT